MNTYFVETMKKLEGGLITVATVTTIPADLEDTLEAAVEEHGLGKHLASSKGRPKSILLFENGRIEFTLR